MPRHVTLCFFCVIMMVCNGIASGQDKKSIPEGNYSLAKISGGSLINLGTLEIRKNTYRTDEKGKFAPFTVDAKGTITWSAGLTFLPDGWKHDYSTITFDKQGKPLIRIHYLSARGTKDIIDGTKE